MGDKARYSFSGGTETLRERSKVNGKRGHKLLTAEARKRLPLIGATEGQGEEAVAQVKFFSPYNGWRWYATEFDGKDTFFGLVEGWESEWGYFSLSELEAATFRGIVPAVERDLGFQPQKVSELKEAA